VKRATAAGSIARCRPFHGLASFLYEIPGACAPGFMLSPASQAVNQYSQTFLKIGDFDFFQFRPIVKTAHGVLNVVHSVAAQITRDVHRHSLDLCIRATRTSEHKD